MDITTTALDLGGRPGAPGASARVLPVPGRGPTVTSCPDRPVVSAGAGAVDGNGRRPGAVPTPQPRSQRHDRDEAEGKATVPLAESPDSSSSSDAGLVLRCRDGDTDAFARLAERHSAAIYGVALAIVRDRGEAEDVTQETLLSAWRKLDSLQEPAAVRTWMFRIAHHRSLEVLRRRGSRATDAVAELPELAEHAVGLGRSSTYGQPERAIEAADAVSTLKAALEALPETQRVVWTLAEIDELSYHEIATVTGASVTTVRGRLARARLNLSEAVTTPR